ncbi:MAG: DUF1810 domain-containing protein [Rhizomicrobium sp.]|jgi:uncharacterized protein (DUF1810 family)
MDDPHNLNRFLSAQTPVFEQVRAELRAGCKRSHWMWFVFPQIQGLGHSDMARRFAIASLDEARAYAAHEILGPRLIECAVLVVAVEGRSIGEIFGSPDDLKFHSSMTLFARAATDNSVFKDALQKYFGGEEDRATVERI